MQDSNYYRSDDMTERKNPLFKILFIVIAVLILIVIVLSLFNAFSGNALEKKLLKGGKEYYSENTSSLPKNVGECNTISLSYLVTEDYVSNAKQFGTCDESNTYVKVCKLSSEKYHYVPVLQCGTKLDTVFGDYKEGKESNLIENSSDVRFSFKGAIYSSQTKVYYPSNKTNEKEVSELYTIAPSNEYTYRGEAVSNAAKWYTQSTGTSYWDNGNYSSIAPSGYPNQGEEGTAITKISLTTPATASYRVIKEQLLYRSRSVASPVPYSYLCFSRVLNFDMVSTIPCGLRTDTYTEYKKINYTCDGTTTVDKTAVCDSSDWTSWSTNACTTEGTKVCESQTGYVYTDRTWKWYVTGTYKSYYPSNSASAAGEKTYYTESPKAGYIKDESSITNAYKYYKLEGSSDGKDGNWINISDDYLDMNELFATFKTKGFDVDSLDDITSNDKLKYTVKLEYSNRQ